MGRSQITPVQQPDEFTCGPAALKHALAILGVRKSVDSLTELCKTNRNGTTTKNFIRAAKQLGLCSMTVERATLRHVQSALKYSPKNVRAALVSYLYDKDKNNEPVETSGHWAVVSSYSASRSRITVFDSYEGKRKSYSWSDFRRRWITYDLKRRNRAINGKQYEMIKKWQPQELVILAKDMSALPKFGRS
jgi:ABC-type bacteriocin/lantibiotic exporter with double-glycine peptidase domain